MVNFQLIGATMFPFIGGGLGSMITRKEIPTWYKTLKKPWFNPPNWVFGPAWTTLYASMGYASYLVYKNGGGFQGDAKTALLLYGTQLALNWAWTPIFFGAHKLKLALAEILCMDIAVAATMYSFLQINPVAGMLMVPYQMWLTLATALNYSIAMNNEDEPQKAK